MLRLSSLSDRAAAILSILIPVSLLASIFVVAAYIRPGGDGTYQPGIRIGNIFSEVPGPFDSDQQMKKFLSQSELRTWNGFYVFGIDDDKQFELKGKIQHEENYHGYEPNYYGSHGRSFYINDSLYTVTPALIKMSDLRDMDEINQLALDGTGQLVGYIE